MTLSVHHVPGMKNECSYYTNRNNFHAIIGEKSQEIIVETFAPLDIQLDMSMTQIRPLDGLCHSEYLAEFGDVFKRLNKRLEPLWSTKTNGRRTRATYGLRIVHCTQRAYAGNSEMVP